MLKVSVNQIDEIDVLINQTGYLMSSFATIYPFRVKFTNIGFERNEPINVPPIGIAVIGINNYIL